ncbi:MAG: hypothetical protein P4L36_19170 [Holophaga sp.]|nr:hypothetical protein [Holophaga sp.]
MVSHGKDKVIQVQKPAQSLQAFQKKVATGEDIQVGYLKPLLMVAGILVVAFAAYFGFRANRAASLEKHQTALADLQIEVLGDQTTPPSPEVLEQRMRERLPRLEALAKSSPRDDRAVTEGLLATWRLQLGEKGAAPAVQTDPWSRLRLARKQVAEGQAQEAAATLASLRGNAGPDQAWAPIFWSTLLDADRLQGNRDQAWKDLADYKARFKQLVDPGLERMLAGV